MNTQKGYEIDQGREESMEQHSSQWLPLTEYALRSGMSISTLRRKIKSDSIEYKMEEGRYLIRSDDLADEKTGFVSSDESALRVPSSRPSPATKEMAPVRMEAIATPAVMPVAAAAPLEQPKSGPGEFEAFRAEFQRMQEDNLLRWKALEARVSGLAKKLEFFSEQMAEARMLVKIFEEKLDQRV